MQVDALVPLYVQYKISSNLLYRALNSQQQTKNCTIIAYKHKPKQSGCIPICTAKTLYRKFETNIPSNETARPRSLFLHSCICKFGRDLVEIYLWEKSFFNNNCTSVFKFTRFLIHENTLRQIWLWNWLFADLLKSNFQKSALSWRSVIPPNTHIAESCRTAECL